MPIEMPSGLPFSVDTWTPSSNKKRHHFLTHAHKDHSQGISTHSSYPIYSTRLTKTLVLQHFPQLDESLFVDIDVGQTLIIDDPDDNFSVTALDANHCPGAVMFLFEGHFGSILHTGDSRLTPECLRSLPEKYIASKRKERRCQLDYIFLDCTFGKYSLKMPSKYSAARQVINCIWKHPDAQVVYLSCDLLGQEDILITVSKTFGSEIYVDKDRTPDFFRALTLTAPEVLSQDPLCRFHVLEGFPRLCERAKTMLAEAQANSQPEPLIIRPSTQWYVHDDTFSYVDGQGRERSGEAVRDQFGIWHICYSMHSSREELECALQLLAPRRVVSTTTSCRAMELSYVKKYCSSKQLSSDDPLWKLLGIRPEACSSSDVSSEEVSCSFTVEDSEVVESQLELIKPFTDKKELLILSPPRKKLPVTLFGRARLGLPDFAFMHEDKKTILEKDQFFCKKDVSELNCENSKGTKTDITHTHSKLLVEKERNFEENCEMSTDDQVGFTQVQYGKSVENKMHVVGEQSESPVEKDIKSHFNAYSLNGSSKGFSDRFRKLYRSINVPVPEPLPSLVELMKTNKRTKVRL